MATYLSTNLVHRPFRVWVLRPWFFQTFSIQRIKSQSRHPIHPKAHPRCPIGFAYVGARRGRTTCSMNNRAMRFRYVSPEVNVSERAETSPLPDRRSLCHVDERGSRRCGEESRRPINYCGVCKARGNDVQGDTSRTSCATARSLGLGCKEPRRWRMEDVELCIHCSRERRERNVARDNGSSTTHT